MTRFPVCSVHVPDNQHGQFTMTPITGEKIRCCKCDKDAVVYVQKSMNLVERLTQLGHIQKLQGKDYILLSGLLMLGHENGLESIQTEIIEHDRESKFAVVKATVKGTRGTFSATGDADPQTCGKKVAAAYIRMAETRSICRALRWYTGVGMTAREELPPQQKTNKGEK